MSTKPPRRKVVKGEPAGPGSAVFRCELECGHVELATGRYSKNAPVGVWIRKAPMTVGCNTCHKESLKP